MVKGHPIFVVGAPRTGTTLMKDILNCHPKIHLFNEVHFFERFWDDRTHRGDLRDQKSLDATIEELLAIVRTWGSDQEVAEILAPPAFQNACESEGGGYAGLFAALLKAGAEREGASHWGDSSPQDVLYLDTLVEWYPDVRIVAMTRDPRAFLASYKTYHRRALADYRERYSPLANSILWRSYMSALLEARDADWSESMLVLRYEDLVSDPEARVRELCEHVGVEFDPGMLEVRAANSSYAPGHGAAGIFASSKDRWRSELSPTEIWLLERICGSAMQELDYAPESGGGTPPAWIELARILSVAPVRLFNTLFRGAKGFRVAKLRRVLGLLRTD